MFSDKHSELDSQSTDARLPSLLALRCFEAAARHENFSRAAAELHLTHGAVSRAVRLLEDELGVVLFERRSRRVFLTDAGRTLARAVGGGLDLMRQAVGELRAHARSGRRWVLSCEPTLLMRWLIPRWPDFQARHPGMDVHLVAGGGPFSFASGIDLAIRRDDFDWPDSHHVEPLFTEKVGPVCQPGKLAGWFNRTTSGVSLKAGAPRLHTRTRPGAWQEWAAAGARAPGAATPGVATLGESTPGESTPGVTTPGESTPGESTPGESTPGESTLDATTPTAAVPNASAQTFDHFYFSLQAAVAGLGVAIGPWHLVRDDLDSGVLVAPMGFVEDGSRYCLFSAQPLPPGSPQAALLAWLRNMA